ncbi:MAG: type VII secretion integral membrane protein EccD [Kineosporiaceae bacterium]
MTTTAGAGTGVIRLTIVCATRRADLVVPTGVPVAHLLPDVVSAVVGGLDSRADHAGYRLVGRDGTPLDPESTMAGQGVGDGDTLTVRQDITDDPPRVYDDLVEAVADAVEKRTRPWTAAANRRTGLVMSAVLFTVAAASLATQRAAGDPVAAAGGVAAALLVAGAVVLGRTMHETETAVVLGWCAAPFAAAAGAALVPDDPLPAAPAGYAGVGLLLVAGSVATALPRQAPALVPVAGLGLALTAGGGAASLGARPAVAYTVVLVAAALLSSGLPRIAFAMTRLRATQAHRDEEILADPAPIDTSQVVQGVVRGRALDVGLTAALALVIAVTAPSAVALGAVGAVTVAAAIFAVALGTRSHRDALLVWWAMGGVLAGAAATGVAVIVEQPAWRPALVVVMLATASVLLLVAALPQRTSVRLGRVVDLLEGIALLSLLPLVVIAVIAA